MNKKIVLRTCVVSKEKLEKKDLFRVVRTPENTLIIDKDNKRINGRGAYLKKDKDVILKAKKSKVLNRVLEVNVPEEIFDELLNNIE